MSEFVVQLLASGAFASVLAGLIIWLTKSWITERLKNAIKHEYDEKLETHKAQLQAASTREIEQLKSQLSIAANEQHLVFSKLVEKRAEVIAEIYAALVECQWKFMSFVSVYDGPTEPDKKKKYVDAMTSAMDFYSTFDKQRIYLPENLCAAIDSFGKGMRSKAIGFGVYVNLDPHVVDQFYAGRKDEAWISASTYFREEVPKTRAALEQELRKIIGVGA